MCAEKAPWCRSPGLRLPNDTQRLSIYGMTGSGKTIAGLWHLQRRNFVSKRWEILDFKRDPSIAKIPRLEEIDVKSTVSKHPGLYVRRPHPSQLEHVEDYLWKLWERGNVGLMIDEGYMVPRLSGALRSLLTQGRSLKVPIINLTQRPSWISPFLMSESDFHQVFFMQNPVDRDKLAEWVPIEGRLEKNYHSVYYDVSANKVEYLAPVPCETEIMNRFDMKMPRRLHLFRGITQNAGSTPRRAPH